MGKGLAKICGRETLSCDFSEMKRPREEKKETVHTVALGGESNEKLPMTRGGTGGWDGTWGEGRGRLRLGKRGFPEKETNLELEAEGRWGQYWRPGEKKKKRVGERKKSAAGGGGAAWSG